MFVDDCQQQEKSVPPESNFLLDGTKDYVRGGK